MSIRPRKPWSHLLLGPLLRWLCRPVLCPVFLCDRSCSIISCSLCFNSSVLSRATSMPFFMTVCLALLGCFEPKKPSTTADPTAATATLAPLVPFQRPGSPRLSSAAHSPVDMAVMAQVFTMGCCHQGVLERWPLSRCDEDDADWLLPWCPLLEAPLLLDGLLLLGASVFPCDRARLSSSCLLVWLRDRGGWAAGMARRGISSSGNGSLRRCRPLGGSADFIGTLDRRSAGYCSKPAGGLV